MILVLMLLSYVGSFLTGTGAAGTNVALTGVGFAPDVIIFFQQDRTGANTTSLGTTHRAVGSANLVNGGGGSVANQVAFGFDTNGGATTTAGGGNSSARCAERLLAGLTDGGSGHVTTMDADGFTFHIDTQFGSQKRLNFLALQGDDIQYVQPGVITEPVAAGDLTVTGVGVMPDVVFFFGIPAAGAAPQSQAGSNLCFGVATREDLGGIGNAVWCGAAKDNVATSVAASYSRTGDCYAQINPGVTAVNSRAHVKSWNNDGFVLTFDQASGTQYKFFYMAIQGCRAKIGKFNAPGDAVTTKVESGINFYPRAVLFCGSSNATESGAGAGHNDDVFNLGAYDYLGNTWAEQFISKKSNNPGGLVVDANRTDSCYIESDTTPAFQVEMNVVSDNLNAFSYKDSLNTPASTNFMWYLALGDLAHGLLGNQ